MTNDSINNNELKGVVTLNGSATLLLSISKKSILLYVITERGRENNTQKFFLHVVRIHVILLKQ